MKKTNNNSPMKRIAASATMLAVSAAMLGTSTYAWFTMNKEVTVTGMQLNTKVSNNLLISSDTLASTARKADDTFQNSLVQTTGGLIEPVSTVDGKAYFYTAGTNVQGDGSVLNQTWTAYDPADRDAFKNEYALDTGDDAYGYIDYVYQLKAVNGSTDAEIKLTQLDLTYGGSAANGQTAYRVAIFAEDLGYVTSAGTTNFTSPTGNLTSQTVASIFAPALTSPRSTYNFTQVSSKEQAVSGTGARDDVVYNTDVTLDVGTNRSQYYKVVVRVWLEGEDTTCNNTTFMDLTDKWKLDMKWELAADSTKTGVSNLGLLYTASKTSLTIGTDNGATTGALTINGVTYYPISGKTLAGSATGKGQLYVGTSATLAADSHIFTIDDGTHPIEVTNQVTINAAGG